MKILFYTTLLLIVLSTKSFGFAVNDSCQGALLLNVEHVGTLFKPLVEDNTNSSNTPMTVCAQAQNFDLWYYFVASNDTQIVYLKPFNVGGNQPYVDLLSGSCGSLTSINCYHNSYTMTGLTPGQTYYLRVCQYYVGYKYEIAILDVPSNDDCGSAFNLSVYRNDQPTIAGLFFWMNTCHAGTNTCNASNNIDIWFKFTATDTTQILYVDSFTIYFDYELFSGSCGSLVSKECGNFTAANHSKLLHNLSIGQTYYFRLLIYPGTPPPLFKVAVMKPLVNDYCQGAISLPMSPSFANASIVPGDLWFAFPSTGNCTSENDAWYKFTATTTSTFVKVQSYYPLNFSVYSGSCGALTNLVCSIPANGKITGLTIGSTYYVQLHTADTKQNYYSIAVTPVLNNDDCGGAIVLTPSDKLYGEHTVAATTYAATQSQAGCTGTADDDVWFTFTANRTNYALDVEAENQTVAFSGGAFVYELFAGSCGSLTSIICGNVLNDLPAQLKNLTIGQQYYLRIYTETATDHSHFTIAIFRSIDECVDAIDLTLTTNADWTQSPIFNSRTATQSMPGCVGNADDDVWFKFTATQSEHGYLFSDYVLGNNTPVIELFTGGCAALVSTKCKLGKQGFFANLSPGQQYYLRAYSNTYALERFRLNIFESPSNDEITGARQVPVTNAAVKGLSHQLLAGATTSFPIYCATAYPDVTDDIWYYFVAPATSHYHVKTTHSSPYAVYLEAYNQYNTTSTIQNHLISCDVLNFALIPATGNVTAGDTVWFRVYSDSSSIDYEGEFDLSITDVNATLDNDEAANALDLAFTNSYQYIYSTSSAYSYTAIPNSCIDPTGVTKDLWFKFNAPALKASIVLDESYAAKSFLEIFSGTPGSLTSVACSDNILNLPPSLIVGQQYYLRVLHTSTSTEYRIGIFYNDTLEKNPLVAVHCMSPNLVPNPSMECTTCDSVCKGHWTPTGTQFAGYYNTDDWFMATDGSVDYMNSCADNALGGLNAPRGLFTGYVFNNIVPRNGKGYLGLYTYSSANYREYIETELTQTLVVGNSYLVSFYVSGTTISSLVTNEIGALLSPDRIQISNSNATNLATNNLPFKPQVSWNDSLYIEADKWYNVSAIIVADKPYKYLTIGSFNSNSNTSTLNSGGNITYLGVFGNQATSYALIEDVLVAEVPAVLDDSCKATLTAIDPVKAPIKTALIIYPNPARTAINWNANQFENLEMNVEVYSITGQIKYSAKTKASSLSIENYLPGIYFIRINDGKNSYSAKFVKEQ